MAALDVAAQYRSWITALLMALFTAALILRPRVAWRAAIAVVAVLVLANLLLARHCPAGIVAAKEAGSHYNSRTTGQLDGPRVDGSRVERSRATSRSPRQAETAR